MLIIFEFEFNLCSVDTAGCIDLFNCQFSTILNSLSINSCCTGNRSDCTDLDYFTVLAAAFFSFTF